MRVPKKTAPTLKDIAEKAGVHIGTVSVVINSSRSGSYVSQATRERILKIAAELQYTPNLVARGLKSLRHNSIGVTFPYPDPTWITSDYYGTSVLTGVIGGAHKSGFNTTIFHKPWRDAKNSAGGFRGQGIDGFLIVSPEPKSDMVSGLAALGIPLVVISSPGDQFGVPSVVVDNALGVRLAMEHLLALGHRRIAHLMDFADQYDSFTRRNTFLALLNGAGITVPADYIPVIGNSIRTGIIDHATNDAAHRLLSLPERPTAVCTTGDGMAMALMDAARSLGISVPEELSIIGFDDIPRANEVAPPLTTLRQPFVEMGQSAARLLISLVDGEPVPPATHFIKPEFIARGTTGRVAH